jgi:hypothetical protein
VTSTVECTEQAPSSTRANCGQLRQAQCVAADEGVSLDGAPRATKISTKRMQHRQLKDQLHQSPLSLRSYRLCQLLVLQCTVDAPPPHVLVQNHSLNLDQTQTRNCTAPMQTSAVAQDPCSKQAAMSDILSTIPEQPLLASMMCQGPCVQQANAIT